MQQMSNVTALRAEASKHQMRKIILEKRSHRKYERDLSNI